MLELSRTLRFCLGADGTLASEAPHDNTFAAWPPMRGLGRYYELTVTCRGEPDPVTGYFINIKQIDRAARDVALPRVSAAARAGEERLGGLLAGIICELDSRLAGSVAAAELRLTPTYAVRMDKQTMDTVLLSQRFEFSAAHRLHAPALSDAENRRVFGKCNNPAGHGHNYQLEVVVRCPVDPGGVTTAVERLDDLVNRAVIEKLDHKHLDQDVPEFRGVNTTVENIARVIFDMLRQPVAELHVRLDEVRVWETGKTVCVYRGESAPVAGAARD